MKSAYIGLVFFAIYIAGVSSTVSNAVISISSAVVLLYTIYDYRQHKLSFPVPGADLQFVWWLFFIALILDSLFLADAEAVKKYQKAIKRQHKIQGKNTEKRMKKSLKKAQTIAKNKKIFFLKRWFNKR